MTDSPDRIVVVGGSAAGLTTAETLRAEGFRGELTLVGAEPHPPYDRPPLSKQVLAGRWEPARVALRSPAGYRDLDVDLRLGTAAVGLDARARTVALDDASVLGYDALVVASGARPRRLPSLSDLPCVHVLRTLDDVVAFRAAALTSDPVLVVGAGFLGLEVAATLTDLGRRVVVVDADPTPLRRPLGALVAGRLLDLHARHGVDVRTGTGVAGCRLVRGGVVEVVLDDGTTVTTGCVLVAVGVTPSTEWLRGSGLRLDDGVRCDAYCRAAPGVYAAGDVAGWAHGVGHRRVEHRTNATEQAMTVARNVLGAAEPYRPVPYFWTDHYDVKVQVYGDIAGATDVAVVHGGPDEDRFAALYGTAGRVVGALGWRAPRELLRMRTLVVDQVRWQEVSVA